MRTNAMHRYSTAIVTATQQGILVADRVGRKSVFGKILAQRRPGAAALEHHKILKNLDMNSSHFHKKIISRRY
jgi:hypothetical protein